MKLVMTQNVTLDGVVDADGGWFEPGDDSGDIAETVREHMHSEDGLLLGRRTFEEFRGFWPGRDDPVGISKHLDSVHKHVVTSTLSEPGWENSSVIDADLLDYVRSLREEEGAEVGVTGSISVCHQLLEAGLVDEIRLFLHPVVMGGGRQLFPDGMPSTDFELAESRPFRSGVVLLRYRHRGHRS
jgi:dihydrofolate reductase